MTVCRGFPDPSDTSLVCAEEAQNIVHGYAMCDACAARALRSTPRQRETPPSGPIDFSRLLGSWSAGR